MTMPDQTPSMPPLPEPIRRQGQQMSADGDCTAFFDCYDNSQMHAYAQAVADERVRAAEAELAGLRAARIAYASEFPPNADGEPDVGSIHANIREMKRKAARYELRGRVRGDAYRAIGVLYSEGGAGLDAAIDAQISTLSLGPLKGSTDA